MKRYRSIQPNEMIQKISLSISALFIACVSLACSCAYSEEFNLVDYDSNECIFEVKIESKYELKKDTVKSDEPKPPSSYEFGLMNSYHISMIEVFKGDLELSEITMDFPNYSSCSWTPEVGVTYIFYANSLNSIEACNRKLIKKYDEENYLNEKSILQSLRTKPAIVKLLLDDTILIEGAHANGKRHGVWNMYSVNEKHDLTFRLTYKNGNLLAIEKHAGYSEENEWHGISYSYFLEQLNKKKEEQE